MSVVVKGMETPENCWQCILLGIRTAIGCAEWTKISAGRYKTERAWSCPITALPDHHGRLADADAMMDDICNSINQMTKIGIAVDGNYLWGKLNDALDNAPTIIEAE